MNNKANTQYIECRWNKKRNFCHWKLGIQQMINYPLLNILLLPIIVLTVTIWVKMDVVFIIFDVPEMLFTIYNITIKIIAVLIPLLLLWALIDTTGSLTAHKDEATVQMAFKEKELRNGSPILMYKKTDKKSGVTVREFYSPIPMKLWIERREEIADAMNIHFVQDFKYGGKSNGNRIVMYSAEGRKAMTRGVLYDDDF